MDLTDKIIIGKQGCPRCKKAHELHPNIPYYKLSDESIGLGDTIAKITCFFGIKPCHLCKVRQYKLNKIKYFWKPIDKKDEMVRNKILLADLGQFPIVATQDLKQMWSGDFLLDG